MRIAVITHEKDTRLRTWLDGLVPRSKPFYQLDPILLAGRLKGLRWFYTDPGQPFRPADAAVLHVDLSLIPKAYLDLAARYPLTINGTVADIRKRHVSVNLVDRTSSWSGPVLVKSDLNCNGGPERSLARKIATGTEQGLPNPDVAEYQLFDNISKVPEPVWADPLRVVERYLPERRGPHNVMRVWNFMGGYERCNWYASPETIIKGRNIVEFGPSEVPDELRAHRKRLGFDYGKFDFAIGPEGPVLYDANRTPGYLHARPDLMRQGGDRMSDALLRLIKG
jgi:hypothetical protein